MKRQIAILGSTGSIGTQALEVIEEHSDLYEVYCLTANNKVELLAEQAHKFKPAAIVIANESRYDALKSLMSDMPDVKVYAGAQALNEIVEAGPINMVLTAMVGFAGLNPTIHAIKAGKTICLANKETLVVAGELILQLAQQYHTPILPVDSEHSAIFAGSNKNTSMRAPNGPSPRSPSKGRAFKFVRDSCSLPLEGEPERVFFLKCKRARITLVLLNTIRAPLGRYWGKERKTSSDTSPPLYTSNLLLSRSERGNLAIRSSGNG